MLQAVTGAWPDVVTLAANRNDDLTWAGIAAGVACFVQSIDAAFYLPKANRETYHRRMAETRAGAEAWDDEFYARSVASL